MGHIWTGGLTNKCPSPFLLLNWRVICVVIFVRAGYIIEDLIRLKNL